MYGICAVPVTLVVLGGWGRRKGQKDNRSYLQCVRDLFCFGNASAKQKRDSGKADERDKDGAARDLGAHAAQAAHGPCDEERLPRILTARYLSSSTPPAVLPVHAHLRVYHVRR
ncbi:hypothetical protein CVT25_001709 [Psilocybe cyanescens]|uniref:Uncharacterized protein n=1 Tax=Psilocybe cyanescens TaxID=93625 RepID=A0A409WPG6_PSICY|nr:hypothetical protein CVT25_001709 [Psilocybe cyanescens]